MSRLQNGVKFSEASPPRSPPDSGSMKRLSGGEPKKPSIDMSLRDRVTQGVQIAGQRIAALPKGKRRASAQNTQEVEALFVAASDGDHESVLAILQEAQNVDPSASMRIINGVNDEGRTALSLATEANQSLTALLLLRLGAKPYLADVNKKGPLSFAVRRKNVTLVLALLSALCGEAGTANRVIEKVLTRREGTQLYKLLASLDAIKAGRAASLLFLVNPETAILTLIRGSTACRDKALMVKGRSPTRAEELQEAGLRLDAAIRALLHHIGLLIVPRADEDSEDSSSLMELSEPAKSHRRIFRQGSVVAALASVGRRKSSAGMEKSQRTIRPFGVQRTQGLGSGKAGLAEVSQKFKMRKKEYSRRDLIGCLLKDSPLIEVAVRYEYKPFFAIPSIMNYLEDQWGGSLVAQQRERDIHADVREMKLDGARGGTITVGARVKHDKHGDGSVVARLKDGRLAVEFDGGETHNYQPESVLAKLTLIEVDEEERDEDEDPGVQTMDLFLALPRFVLQGLLLWTPLALFPGSAAWLRKEGGLGYLLEVPVLKFLITFFFDIILFVSLTVLSHPQYYTLLGWKPWKGTREPLEIFAPIHLVWALGVLVNEWRQFLMSKAETLVEFVEVLQKTKIRSAKSWFALLGSACDTIFELFQVEIIEVCDLFGPLFACVSLLTYVTSGNDMLPNFLAIGLFLMGIRLLRLITMNPTIGPLVLMINKMLFDVWQWILVQVFFMIGFASAFYALAGDKEKVFADQVYLDGEESPAEDGDWYHESDTCELLLVGGAQSQDDTFYGSLEAWLKLLLLLTEFALLQEAPLGCMRLFSKNPIVSAGLLMLFQLFTGVVMLNMLIAMMAKTFDLIHGRTAINFNFLRASTIHTWVQQHPSPPPFNLLTLIPTALSGPIKLYRHCRAGREEDQKQTRGVRVSRIAKALNRPPAHFLLISDFHDEPHVRMLAKRVGTYVQESIQEANHKAQQELSEGLARLETALEAVTEKTEGLFGLLSELAPRQRDGGSGGDAAADAQAPPTGFVGLSDDEAGSAAKTAAPTTGGGFGLAVPSGDAVPGPSASVDAASRGANRLPPPALTEEEALWLDDAPPRRQQHRPGVQRHRRRTVRPHGQPARSNPAAQRSGRGRCPLISGCSPQPGVVGEGQHSGP